MGCFGVIGSCKHFIFYFMMHLALFGVLELFSSGDHKKLPQLQEKIKFLLLRVPEAALNLDLGVQTPQQIHSKETQSYPHFT